MHNVDASMKVGKSIISNNIKELIIRRPDDWHVHLREGLLLEAVLPFTARQFARAIVMPNLTEPVTNTIEAEGYRSLILKALAKENVTREFIPLMTAYLTDMTKASDLARGYSEGIFAAAKLYPANSTTNSAHGVSDIAKLKAVLNKMEDIGMPLLIHGEVTDAAVDVFDREAVFIRKILKPLINEYPKLKVVLEHITTSDAVDFVSSMKGKVAATITAHHLIINRNSLFQGGFQPHNYCLPVAKRERHRMALRKAVTSGDPWFFLGTDSAPHTIKDKETNCGCAGIFSAPSALELYATVFEEEGVIEKFENFASIYGPAYYGLEINAGTVTLTREECMVPQRVTVADGTEIKPFLAGKVLGWRLKDKP